MATDMFLQVDGIQGEAVDENHKGWISVYDFTWGAEQKGVTTTGGGAGAGKVHFDDLVVYAQVDKASPTLLKYCATGQHIKDIVLSVNKAGGSQVEYINIKLSEVIVVGVKYLPSDENDETVKIAYSFQSRDIASHYWEQTDKGTKGAEVQMSYDIKKNVSK